MLGVVPTARISIEQAAELGLNSHGGIRIGGTVPNTGAAQAGLEPEDIIIRIGDTDIIHFRDFAAATAENKVGNTLQMDIYRNSQIQTISSMPN